MSRRKALAASSLVVALALLASACAPSSIQRANTTVTAEPSSSRAAVPAPPDDPIPATAYVLTGADAEGADNATLTRPAIAVKIENTDAARPQTNLDKADIVFEEYVEAGISRLVAVFQSQYPEDVGPVRSLRPMDRNIIGQFKGPIAFSGAQRRFITQAQQSGVQTIAEDVGSYGFFRTSDRLAPHNLHGNLNDFYDQIKKKQTPDEPWDFAYPAETATAVTGGDDVSRIEIVMSGYAHPGWRWDSATSLFKRTEKGVPHTVVTGDQLTATNVVMLWVTVQYTSSVPGGMSVPETLVAGKSGTGYLATGGKVIDIEWSKKGQFDPFVFTTTDGEDVSLAPGQTWVELVPNKGVGNTTSISFS